MGNVYQTKCSGNKFWSDRLYHVPESVPEPPPAPPTPLVWFDAESLGLSDGAPVTSWADIDDTVNFTQAGSGGITYVVSSINGLPAVRFSNANYLGGALTLTNGDNYSVFVILQQTSVSALITNSPAVAFSFGHGGGGTPTYWTGYTQPIMGSSYLAVSQSQNDMIGSINNDTNPHLTEGIHSSPNITGYIQGTQIGVQSINAGPTGNDGTIGNYVGGTNPFIGDIAEILIFDSALNTSDRQSVENYLIYKYDL